MNTHPARFASSSVSPTSLAPNRSLRTVEFLSRIEESLESRGSIWLHLFVCVFLAVSVVTAIRKPLWTDEIFTYYIATQHSLREMVQAIMMGCDGMPPLYAFLVHQIKPICPSYGLALRLPSLIGYCAMCFSFAAFLRRRMSGLYTAIALFTCVLATLRYATEGRPYGLVMGCMALSLLCWQNSNSVRFGHLAVIALAFSLSLAIALHHFALFCLPAFWVGEAIRLRLAHRTSALRIAAITAPILVMVPHLPLISAARRFLPHFWSKVRWASVPESYLFLMMLVIGLAVPIGLLIFAGLTILTRSAKNVERPIVPPYFTAPENAVLAGLALLPVIVFVCSEITTKVFVPRYSLPAALGLAAFTPVFLFRVSRGSRMISMSFLLALAFVIATMSVRGAVRTPKNEGMVIAAELDKLPVDSAPIVITSHQGYFQLPFYADGKIRRRILHVNDQTADIAYYGSDSDALMFEGLARLESFPIASYSDLKQFPRFLLLTDGQDWLPLKLRRSGWVISPLGPQFPFMYNVERRGTHVH